MYLVEAKKMPGTVSPEPGVLQEATQPNSIKLGTLSRQGNYTDFSPALQEIEDYELDEVSRKRIQNTKYLVDNWMDTAVGQGLLTKLERRVLNFLVNRTMRYGKTAEIVTRGQFLRGFAHSGTVELDPPATNPMQWYRSIASLEAKGFVSRWILTDSLEVHRYTAYKVEVIAILASEGEITVPKLKVSKKRIAQNEPTPLGQNRPTKYIKENNKEILEYEITRAHTRVRGAPRRLSTNAIDCKQTVEDVVKAAALLTKEKREAKVRKGKTTDPKTITLSSLNATWQKIMIEEYGNAVTVVALTVREFGIFKSAIKSHHISFKWEDFLRWCVQSWAAIAKDQTARRNYAKKTGGDTGDAAAFTINPSLSGVVRRFAMYARLYSDESYMSRVSKPSPAATDSDVAKMKAKLGDMAGTLRRVAAEHAEELSDLRSKLATATKLRLVASNGVLTDDGDDLPDWPGKG